MRLRLLTGAAILALLVPCLATAQDELSYAYHFPRFSTGAGSEIRLVNLGNDSIIAQIEFFSTEGPAGGTFQTVPPLTRQVVPALEIGASGVGSVRVKSSAPLVVSAVLVEQGGAVEVAAPAQVGSTIIIPFAHGIHGNTFLDVFNADDRPSQLFIYAYDSRGRGLAFADRTLEPEAGIHEPVSGLFGPAVAPPADLSHIIVRRLSNVLQKSGNIAASALVEGFNDPARGISVRSDPALVPGASDRNASPTLDLPLLVQGNGMFTLIQVVNASTSLQTISIRAILNDGSELGTPVQATLGNAGTLRQSASEMFGLPKGSSVMGSLRIEGTAPLAAAAAIGHAPGSSLTVISGTSEAATNLVWRTRNLDRSLYDGITFLNREQTTAGILLSFLKNDGTRVTDTFLTVPPGRQITTTVGSLLPEVQDEGVIVARSDTPIIALGLTGQGVDILRDLPIQKLPGSVELPAQTEFLVVGAVTTNGAALPGANVHLTGPVSGTLLTDAVGTFTFNEIPEGAYTLTVQAPGYSFTPASVPFTITDANSRNNDFAGTLIKPVITAVTPPGVVVDSPGTPVTITGGPFIESTAVLFEGTVLPTTLIDSQTVTATISALSLTLSREGPLLVRNRDASGATVSSDPVTFTVGSPPPVIAALTDAPEEILRGRSDLTIGVLGEDFVEGTTIQVNGIPRTTTFISENELSVTIPAEDLTTAGTRSITAIKPAPTAGPSNELAITVLNPVAGLLSISPDTIVGRPSENAEPVSLDVTGFSLVPGATVLVDDEEVPTTFVDYFTLNAQIPAKAVSDGGPRRITVRNPEPVQGREPPSETLPLWVRNPVPVLESISFGPVIYDDARGLHPNGDAQEFVAVVVLNGANFNSSTTAFFGGGCEEFEVTGSLLNSRQMVFEIPVTCSSPWTVLVENAQPGGGESQTLDFTVQPGPDPIAQPMIDAIAPTSVAAGSGSVSLTITGSDFSPLSKVVVGTAVLTPTSVTPTQIVVSIPSVLLGAPGYLPVVVTHPDGGDSNRTFFTVLP